MVRKTINATFLLVLVFATTALANAQTAGSDEAIAPNFATQLQFVGQEPYHADGSKGTRYKLSVINRASHPDFLWQPTSKLCGKLENSSRTWVEVFGSPGDKRLAGFCGLRSSEDLGHLWFPAPSGEKGPQCVYIVMNDRQTGRKYISNRVCSRSFTVVRGRLTGIGQSAAPARHKRDEWIEITSVQSNQAAVNVNGGSGSDRIFNASNGSRVRLPDAVAHQNKVARMALPDLRIRQFLFPPTNDKALRVYVVNTGLAAAGACRLILTVRKINGIAAGRKIHVNVPALAAGGSDWLHIDVKSILPNNVSLKSTTFKLNVDGSEIVAESDEGNNEVWHNL